VAEVGPGGHFLKARQTRRFLHDAEHHRPALMLREAYELWSAHRQGEYQRAVETVERLLGSHQPKPLPEGCERRFAEIVRAAAEELRER
jgi:trimethylamine:corrinoid methyltransferase-like protein